MAELDKTKPNDTDADLADLEWATSIVSPAPELSTPSPAKRSAGWVDDEEPPFEIFNWFWRLVALATVWLGSWKIRAFSDLESALDDSIDAPLDAGHFFLVGRPAGFTQPFGEVWAEEDAVGAFSAPTIACDGQFAYYAIGDTVYKANRATGAELTNRQLVVGSDILWVFADGARVVAVLESNATGEVFALSRVDLTNLANFPVNLTDAAQHCTSNGNVFAIAGGGASQDVETYTSGGGLSSIAFGALTRRVAIDYAFLFIGGAVHTGNQVKGYLGFAGAPTWSKPLLVEGTEINDMVSDGLQLFYVTEGQDLGAKTYNVTSRDRETGLLNWRVGAPNEDDAVDAEACCVDETYLYVASGNFVYQLDKFTGATVRTYDHAAAVLGLSCDGDAIFICGARDVGDGRIRRLDRGNGTKMFVKALGTDGNRRTFPRLAIPVENN